MRERPEGLAFCMKLVKAIMEKNAEAEKSIKRMSLREKLERWRGLRGKKSAQGKPGDRKVSDTGGIEKRGWE